MLATAIAGMELQRSNKILEDRLINYWIAVGIPANWTEAFKSGNIWGLKQTQKHYWETLHENDIVLFYATQPIAGVIGYGSVQTKFLQDKPLWPEEIREGRVIWPLRFEFTVEYCLPPDKWETNRTTSDTLKFKSRFGFQTAEPQLAEQLISDFRLKKPAEVPSSRKLPQRVAEQTGTSLYGDLQQRVDERVEIPLHKELQQKLVEIGQLQKYVAEKEYPFDLGRLDVVWRRIELSVPTYVFEIQIGGDIYHALAKLKHAYDLWNSRLFLIASQADHDKARSLLGGTFHEISHRVKFIELSRVDELYKRKRAYLDLEKELGILGETSYA
jgi:predicted RNA-binding protein